MILLNEALCLVDSLVEDVPRMSSYMRHTAVYTMRTSLYLMGLRDSSRAGEKEYVPPKFSCQLDISSLTAASLQAVPPYAFKRRPKDKSLTAVEPTSPPPEPPHGARRHTNVGFAFDTIEDLETADAIENPLRYVEYLRQSLLEQEVPDDLTVTQLTPDGDVNKDTDNDAPPPPSPLPLDLNTESSAAGRSAMRMRSQSLSLHQRQRRRYSRRRTGSQPTSRQSLALPPPHSPLSETGADVTKPIAVVAPYSPSESVTGNENGDDVIHSRPHSHTNTEDLTQPGAEAMTSQDRVSPPELQSHVPEFWPINNEDNLPIPAQPSIDASYDEFENCLSITQQMDSILSYYYTEEADPATTRVAELFSVGAKAEVSEARLAEQAAINAARRQQRVSVHAMPTSDDVKLQHQELCNKLEEVRTRLLHRRDSM